MELYYYQHGYFSFLKLAVALHLSLASALLKTKANRQEQQRPLALLLLRYSKKAVFAVESERKVHSTTSRKTRKRRENQVLPNTEQKRA